jgi:sugar/nucleoside kinase (ribokinase family)
MAARTLLKNVLLISAIGTDYQYQDTLNHLDCILKVYNTPSTRFHIQYDQKWEARYLHTEWGASPRVNSVIASLEDIHSNCTVHFSPMNPTKIVKILRKLVQTSHDVRSSINTWLGYIKGNRKNRRILKELASQVDFFILNDSEAKALAETDSISTALRLLEAKMLIVTLGQLGAIISGKSTGIQMVPALYLPPEKIVDTTGAGDVWCGAFLATYNITKDLMKSISVASILSRIKCSNWGFNNLINLRFRTPDSIIEHVIGLREGSYQKSLVEYFQ